MKKCITGVGLLLAALILFGCQKPMAEMTLDKFPEVQTVTLPKTATAADFDSRLNLDSGTMAIYAVRVAVLKKDVAVNTVFNDAYFIENVSSTKPASLDNIKAKLGFDKSSDFVVGDDIIVGYRAIKQSGKIPLCG